MVPLSPISRKRSIPIDSDSQDGHNNEPQSKKRGIENSLPHTPPPDEDLPMAKVIEALMFNDAPRELLLRSVATILQHVGFSGASEEALEALCAEVDSCQYILERQELRF